jgi:hypothetical protein
VIAITVRSGICNSSRTLPLLHLGPEVIETDSRGTLTAQKLDHLERVGALRLRPRLEACSVLTPVRRWNGGYAE